MLTVSRLLEETGGRLLAGDPTAMAQGVSTDSRTIQAGQLFVALYGPRFDGHDFVSQALGTEQIAGAAGAIIEPARCRAPLPPIPPGRFVIGVADTLVALQVLAQAHRARLRGIPLVAITGSNGKTTTKEMAAGILSRRFTVLKNEGNQNNTIGVPLTLLRLTPTHQAAVIEMGISEPGELSRLCEMAQPTIGVITNIGRSHLATLGDLEGVARAKGELLDGLHHGDGQGQGLAILNADDPFSLRLARRAKGPIMTFGMAQEADLRACDVRDLPPVSSGPGPGGAGPGATFTLKAMGGSETEVRLSVHGRHNVLNAAAAAAVGVALQVDLMTIRRGLESFSPVLLRSELIEWHGLRILNDAYNANPDSMRVALETLVALKGSGRAIAVLGDMLELGGHETQAHRELGEQAARLGLEGLILLGESAGLVADGAVAGGLPAGCITRCDTHETAKAALEALARPGDICLVKGSRRMRMEKVVELLLAA